MKIGIPLFAALVLYWIVVAVLGSFVRFEETPFLSLLVVVVSVSVFVGTYLGLVRVLNRPRPDEPKGI